MSSVFLYDVAGIKVFCSECRYGFVANKQLQRRWFNQEPLPCPTCASLQVVPQEQLATLTGDINCVKGYMTTITLISLFNMVFWGDLLAGAHFSDEAILTVIVLSPTALLLLRWVMLSAIDDLRVQLKKYDAP